MCRVFSDHTFPANHCATIFSLHIFILLRQTFTRLVQGMAKTCHRCGKDHFNPPSKKCYDGHSDQVLKEAAAANGDVIKSCVHFLRCVQYFWYDGIQIVTLYVFRCMKKLILTINSFYEYVPHRVVEESEKMTTDEYETMCLLQNILFGNDKKAKSIRSNIDGIFKERETDRPTKKLKLDARRTKQNKKHDPDKNKHGTVSRMTRSRTNRSAGKTVFYHKGWESVKDPPKYNNSNKNGKDGHVKQIGNTFYFFNTNGEWVDTNTNESRDERGLNIHKDEGK